MIFEASKRPFGHPVPLEAIGYYLHPLEAHAFARAAWGRDSKLYVANGWVALRFFNFSAAFGSASQEVVDRLRRQPWRDGKHEDPKAWRKLDDATLDIFRGGLLEPWHAERPGCFRASPCVRINHGALVPAASLQMVSRLPRCEVYTTLDRGAPVAIRFNGGDGLLARLPERAEAGAETLCHIFPMLDR